MSQLSKNVIHNQVSTLAERHFGVSPTTSDELRRRALSKAYTQLCILQLLEMDEEAASDAVVDGSNDMGIDGIWIEEPQSEYFDVHLFQIKYSEDLDRDKGFPENEVIKIINSLRTLLKKDHFKVNDALELQLALVKAHVNEFNIPNFNIYLCNNGQGLSPNAQAHIDAFLTESPENAKRYRFQYINHVDIFRASERAEPVNCALEFAGGFVDEAINFKRAFVGKVQIAQIAELLNQFQDRLLGRNVQDFLGFRRVVNEGIRDTLQNQAKCKDFYFLNNGITFVCEKLDYAQGAHGARARLTNAQIINGGQTSRTIQTVVHEAPNVDFSQAYVLVRAYQVDMDDEGDLIQDIITATNSQNAIFARDLHANDPVQRNIEAGLKHYGIRYLRRRDYRRAKPEDIRMEVAAETLVTVLLKKPIDAKYRKALHFTPEFYPEIFDEKRITPELVWFAADLFKKIESRRKHPVEGVLSFFPFIPMASHLLLMLMHHDIVDRRQINRDNIKELQATINGPTFDKSYDKALRLILATLQQNATGQMPETDAYTLAQALRNEQFVQTLWREATEAGAENAS
jgi:hypothetical protein